VILQSHPSDVDAWVVVAGPTALLALPASASERVPELSARLSAPEGFRSALEALLGDGIANAPSFALLDDDAAVLRAVLRGAAAVSANVAGAEITFSGEGMETWTERVLEGAGSLQLTVPGSTWTVLLGAGSTSLVGAPVVGAPAAAPAGVAPAENTLVPSAEVEVPAIAPSASQGAAAPVAQGGADADASADSGESAYDFLFGDTIYRTQAGASIRIPNPDPERPGDHDGHTMLAEELGRAGHVPAMSEASEATVLAPIPPRAPVDSAAPVEHVASLPLAPALQLERRDGSRESLARPVLIGRSPASTGTAPEPRLIAVLDDPDISRSHLRVAVEGDVVVVTDLGSKNGTLITLPGAAPRKLRASEPTVVLPGTLIDLGGGTAFIVREG
jgi:hypothetical protein